MSPSLHLFQYVRILKNPIKVILPDGTFKLVTKIGNIQINSLFLLIDVFYVPNFKINLLSVGKLLHNQHLIAIFYPTWFSFLDTSTNKVVAVGKGFRKLYALKATGKSSSPPFTSSVYSSFVNQVSNKVDVHLFHARPGHTSVSIMIHVDDCKHLNKIPFFCDTCILAKHHRLSFPLSTSDHLSLLI